MRVKAANYISCILLIAALVPIVYFSYVAFESAGYFASDIAVVSVILIAVFLFVNHLLHVILHETGHLLFGLCVGYRPYSFGVGPFVFRRGKIDFKLKNHSGSCVMVPRSADKFYKKNFVYLLGGTVFSLILAVASALAMFLPMGLKDTSYLFLASGFPVHAYLFVKNILPYSSLTAESDGAKMLGILRKTPAMRINLKLFSVQCLLMSGVRPRDIDPELLFDIPVVADNSPERILMEDYRYLYHLDRGDGEKAIKSSDFIEQFLPEVDRFYYQALLADVYFTAVRFKKDFDRAKEMYDEELFDYVRAERNIVNLRIRMSYELYIENKPKFALATGRDAADLGKDFIMKGVVPLEEELIADMAKEADERREKFDQEVAMDTMTEYRG